MNRYRVEVERTKWWTFGTYWKTVDAHDVRWEKEGLKFFDENGDLIETIPRQAAVGVECLGQVDSDGNTPNNREEGDGQGE